MEFTTENIGKIQSTIGKIIVIGLYVNDLKNRITYYQPKLNEDQLFVGSTKRKIL